MNQVIIKNKKGHEFSRSFTIDSSRFGKIYRMNDSRIPVNVTYNTSKGFKSLDDMIEAIEEWQGQEVIEVQFPNKSVFPNNK